MAVATSRRRQDSDSRSRRKIWSSPTDRCDGCGDAGGRRWSRDAMASDPTPSLDVEIAHILFMDIVGYTLLPMDEQTRLVRQLQSVVRGTVEFSRAEPRGELICLPAGDGMALVFLRDPIAPVRCAIEITRAVRDLPSMRLRMGIHSGPVCRGE